MRSRALLTASLLAISFESNIGHTGVVEDYNAKPIASSNTGSDSRWKERARMATDPEVVLGKDWRRSFWAFSPSIVSHLDSQAPSRPPQPAHLLVEKLAPGLEAIELRVSWDVEENLYRCSYHAFFSPDVPIPLPSRHVGGMLSIPRFPIGIGPDDTHIRREWLGATILIPTVQMLGGPTILEAIYKYPPGNLTYVAFYQGGTCGALSHSSAEKKLEFGVVINPKQPWSGVTKKVRDSTYAIFTVPSSLIRAGAPYFRRAEKINGCYLGERRPSEAIAREPTSFRNQREQECKQLRSLPIDSTEKPIDAK